MLLTGVAKPESSTVGTTKEKVPMMACCWVAQKEEIISPIPISERTNSIRHSRTSAPPISPANLVRAIGDSGIASRNTVHTFLMEMRRYHFVTPLARADGRQRAVEAPAMSEGLIRRYFDIHLRALDRLDAGLLRGRGGSWRVRCINAPPCWIPRKTLC